MASAGWYGKLSGLGDFASRRLPAPWVQACDQWLSACMTSSRQQLGERWLQAYLDAPVWRYAWAPGVVDAQWWFGVLMPSCDKVGRYFPLLVAQSRAAPPLDRYALDHLDLWWAQAAQAALQTLAEGASLEQFEAALEDLPPWPGARFGGAPAAQAALPGAGVPVTLAAAATLQDLVQGLAVAQLQAGLQGHSFWWPWRAGGPAPQALLVPGLPASAAFSTLLAPVV